MEKVQKRAMALPDKMYPQYHAHTQQAANDSSDCIHYFVMTETREF